jgi:hypothetical protein
MFYVTHKNNAQLFQDTKARAMRNPPPLTGDVDAGLDVAAVLSLLSFANQTDRQLIWKADRLRHSL